MVTDQVANLKSTARLRAFDSLTLLDDQIAKLARQRSATLSGSSPDEGAIVPVG